MSVKPVRRYSEAFKLQVISELESGKLRSHAEAQRKYGIQGASTLAKWLRKYGKTQLIPGVLTVIKPDENDRLKQLELENRRLKQALADAHLDSVLHQAWFQLACQHGGIQDQEEFKKKLDTLPWNAPAKRRG